MDTGFVLSYNQHRDIIDFLNRVASVQHTHEETTEIDGKFTDKVLNQLRKNYQQAQRVNEIIMHMLKLVSLDESHLVFARRLQREVLFPQLKIDRSKYFYKRYATIFPHTLAASSIIPTLLGFLLGYFLNGIFVSIVTTFLVVRSFKKGKKDVLDSPERIEQEEKHLVPIAFELQTEFDKLFIENLENAVQIS